MNSENAVEALASGLLNQFVSLKQLEECLTQLLLKQETLNNTQASLEFPQFSEISAMVIVFFLQFLLITNE
jgi:hypothetical protein